MSNDGLRVIERRGSDLFWTMTDRGVEHNGKRRKLSFEDVGRGIDQYLRFQDFGRHFKKQARQRSS